MNIKKYISTFLFLLLCVAAWSQNTLSVGSLSGGQGKDVMIPISMDNVDEIVALQFNLQLPFSKSSKDAELTSRNINGHTISVRSLGGNKYTVVIVNMSNKPLGGTGGTLINFPMRVPSGLAPDTSYDISISDLVMTNRKGDNIQTGAVNGSYTVVRSASPDLSVSDVQIAETELEPGGKATLTWKVSNIGDDDTHSGWTEKIYLVSSMTEETVYVGNCYYSDKLAKGGNLVRNHILSIPKTIGLDGEVKAKVVVEPNSSTGEYVTDRLNNTALSGAGVNLKKSLFLTAPADNLKEGQSMRLTLTRSGDRTTDETFEIATSLPANIMVPSSITIRSGNSTAYFDVVCPDNKTVNEYSKATVTVRKANEYPEDVMAEFTIEDDELIPITLSFDKSDYNEGDIMKVTAEVAYRINNEPITLSLSIEKAKRFRLPQTVVIEPGQTSVVIDVPIVQDNIPANDETIQMNVSAAHYQPSSGLFILHDDDVPAITLTMQPTEISEAAGYNAIFAKIRRVGAANSKITLKLSDDSNGELYYQQTLTMNEGVQELTFPIGVRDNQKVDGTRKVKFNASIYITDCGCSAIGDKQTSVSDTISINDNDGPTLTVSSNKTTILEGDSNGATLTISRNDDTSKPLTVALTSNGKDVEHAASVIIPAGSESVTTTFKALSNDETEGNRTISVKASADGYSQGSVWMLISDQTLPDAEMQTPEFEGEVMAGSDMRIKVNIRSIGAIAVPKGTNIKVTVGSVTTNIQTSEEIIPGGSHTAYAEMKAPEVPGNYTVVAHINPNGSLTELQTLNNSAVADLRVTSAYDFTIAADKDKYLIGQTVRLSGKVMRKDGTPAVGIEVEPYIVYASSRTKLTATTDNEGNYAAEYVIPAGMGGEYGYGICTLGENVRDVAGEFSVYGFSRTNTDYITHKLFVNEPYPGVIKLKNMGNLPLHNIKGSCADAGNYNVTFFDVAELPANGTADVAYMIVPSAVSSTNDWDRIAFSFTSDEGASLDVMTYNYTQEHTPTIVVGTTNINTTVTKGKTRLYPVTITNTGLAETGKITVSLPTGLANFISLATPKTMPSLATGDSATVMLRFNAADYDVNIIQKGNIAINCENGNGKSVNFNVKVVSEDKGNLLVKVHDENTDQGKGYLANATVKLSDYNTGALVVQDVTGEDGTLLLKDINEGYYRLYVTADKHDSYTQNVLVSPGVTTEHIAVVSYQAISVSWEVEETEIDDEYEIVTEVTYETQVPVPVVEMTMPDTLLLENIQPGQTALFNVVLRNRGLITAQDVNFDPPSAEGFVFMPMVEYTGLNLAPEQSYVIPVLVMHAEDYEDENFAKSIKRTVKRSEKSGGIVCRTQTSVQYSWPCGPNAKFAWITRIIQLANSVSCKSTGGGTIIGGGPGGSGGGGGIGPVKGPDEPIKPSAGGEVNTAALLKFLCIVCECACVDPMPPCGAPALDFIFERSATQFAKDCAADIIKTAAGKWGDAYTCLKAILGGLKSNSDAPRRENEKGSGSKSQLISSLQKEALYYNYYKGFYDYNVELTGAPEALAMQDTYAELTEALSDVDYVLNNMKEQGTLWNFDITTIPDLTEVEDKSEGVGPYLTSLMPNKSAVIADLSLRSYVERVRNKWRKDAGMDYDSANHPDESVLSAIVLEHDSCIAEMVKKGMTTPAELINSARKDWLEYQESQSGNTCAEVKLEIKQKLVLTRQAFRGTLTIDNGSASDLNDLLVHVDATNMATGAISTSHEMEIHVESIEGFGGSLEGPWTLEAGKKGVATILFIPTKYAAPDTLTTYSFGGSLSFNDGSSVQTRLLYPVSLQVKPSPELDLTYFMQRDVYGDNPLTIDVVEPVVPAEFSVLINNKGNGDANNVRMITQKPKIVENEKGLMIDFDIVSSSLNGSEKAMALEDEIATQFGDIKAGTAAYATWDLTCSLMGHFTDYNVSYTHVTDYDNPDLSLLDQVTIHELIHSINATIGDKKYRAWITNDYADAHDEPDRIYFSNGTCEDLATLKETTELQPLGNSRYRLSVNVPQKQWFYTSVTNPAGKYAKILSILNEDTGEQMDAENFWTTDYTMGDGIDPIADSRLHIADLSNGAETRHYIIEFEPMPEVRLAVNSIETVPDDNQIAEQPIDELTVTFNKGIDPATFSRDDIVLRLEGKPLTADLPISSIEGASNSVFKLNTSSLTENGYYALQVNCDSITDCEGYRGGEGMLVRWMLFKDGLVTYNFSVLPSPDCGDIEMLSADSEAKGFKLKAKDADSGLAGSAGYGEMLTITAKPNPGYKFMYWKSKVDDEILSYESSYNVELNKTLDISAVFAPESYNVTINCDAESGKLTAATGIYDYGTVITLDAAANEGYRLDGYRINGNLIEINEPYALTVEGETVVDVIFTDLTPKSVLLRESEDYEPEDIENAHVSFYRTFTKDVWNTVCLPCSVEKPEEVFGEGTKVAAFVRANATTMTFKLVETMQANVPYLIKPGRILTPAYAATPSPTILYDLGECSTVKPDGEYPEIGYGNITFLGTYKKIPIPAGEGYYYINGNLIYYVDSNADVNIGRFRGYFHNTSPESSKMYISFDESSEVDIPTYAESVTTDVYTTSGVMVRKAGESLNGLKPGIYITNDKKVVVR